MEEEPEVTLADVIAMLKLTAKVSDLADVAKISDLTKIQDTVSTHSFEIQQLREDLATQTARIQQLEDNMGRQAASMLNRNQPDVYPTRPNQYGGAQSDQSKQFDQRKQNLVFEGIDNMTDIETIAYILQIASELGIVAYKSDIDMITRMKRRDDSTRPMPVLVTFAQQRIRSAILRNKFRLADIERFSKVFINLDEPIEIRRAKAVFRRIGYKARQDGCFVQIRDAQDP